MGRAIMGSFTTGQAPVALFAGASSWAARPTSRYGFGAAGDIDLPDVGPHWYDSLDIGKLFNAGASIITAATKPAGVTAQPSGYGIGAGQPGYVPPATPSAVPSWALPVGLGVGALAIVGIFLAMQKKRR